MKMRPWSRAAIPTTLCWSSPTPARTRFRCITSRHVFTAGERRPIAPRAFHGSIGALRLPRGARYAYCVLGLPDSIHGCLFDLDGVLTKTSKVHDAAWKEMFDDFLRDRSRRTGQPFVPFDAVADYDQYVDGK